MYCSRPSGSLIGSAQHLKQQEVVLLPQLRQRCLALPAVEGPKLIEQIIDLILEGEFGEYADGMGIP